MRSMGPLLVVCAGWGLAAVVVALAVAAYHYPEQTGWVLFMIAAVCLAPGTAVVSRERKPK